KYNCIAAAGERHLAEFMPGDLYLKNPETVKQWKFGLTTVSWRKNDLTKRLEKAKRLSEGAEEVTLRHSGEDTIALIRALCGLDGRLVTNVNYPNTALQISNLPADATVETNAIFSYDNLQPVQSGSLPEEIRELILPHVRNQKEILQAALSCNRNLVYEVFAREPMIAGRLTQAQYKALADEMIDNTVAFLPKGWK
ncbi:MAG: alpha-glucosidase/alpha-galactosidase, partial [Lachnospiraceae bacterium]|nr:alpha-glucosidase/alpha-galactosidase [Lachnospiraceae bacterium]